jgi:Trk-type K+ transport system membrane component
MLFPSINTQALLLTVFLIQISQWFVSLTLDWRSASLIDKNPAEKFLITFYQSISTRTAGFNVVDMSKLNPPLEILTLQGQTSPARQLLESAFMYMASVPVVVTLRASAIVHSSPAVQEEEEEMMRKKPGLFSGPLQVMQWMKKRNFLIREAGLLFFLILLITIFEDKKFPNDINFDVFRVIYESVSAYGTVGLSLGYPNQVTSFSARFSTISKFIMCIIMLMGRQRGKKLLGSPHSDLNRNPDFD